MASSARLHRIDSTKGEYFRNYYAQTGLAEEVGYLLNVHENLSIVISLMRKSRRFSKAEFKALNAVCPVINAAAQRHWQSTARAGNSPRTRA